MYFRQKNKEKSKAPEMKTRFNSERLPALESEHEKYSFSI